MSLFAINNVKKKSGLSLFVLLNYTMLQCTKSPTCSAYKVHHSTHTHTHISASVLNMGDPIAMPLLGW